MRIYDPKKILVPVDFSEHTMGVLQAAIEIAERWDAQTTVFHVARETDFLLPAVPHGAAAPFDDPTTPFVHFPDRKKILDDARLQLEARIEDLVEKANGGSKVEAKVVWDETLRGILRAAEKDDYDLIIMATHGRSGLSRFLLGSITEQVIRRAPCPVLAVRAKMAGQRLALLELIGQESMN